MLAVPITRVVTSTIHRSGETAKFYYIKLNFIQNFVYYIYLLLSTSVCMLIYTETSILKLKPFNVFALEIDLSNMLHTVEYVQHIILQGSTSVYILREYSYSFIRASEIHIKFIAAE
jgi:hypothetical protein